MVGIDVHTTPGIIKVRQKLTANSGTTVSELCKVAVQMSDGSQLWFSYTSGKIWRKTSADAWSLVYTTTPAAGNAGCLGAAEYDGYIYWATQSRLHRKPVTNLSSWADVEEDFGTFTNADSSFHPMKEVNAKLFIGDGCYVAKVYDDSGHVFSANALDLKSPYRVKCLEASDIDLLIGVYVADTVNEVELITWDTVSTSWNYSDSIPENGINAFIRDDNYIYVQAGQFGRFYLYDAGRLIPYKRLRGTWSPTSYGEVWTNSVAVHLGIPIFGFSNGSGNPCLQGIYSFGSYSKDYPKIMDLSYVISSGATSSVQVGAILASGANFYVAWYDGTNYKVDKIDWSNKYTSAYIETMVLTPTETRSFLKSVLKIIANYASLPTGTSITFSYKKKFEASWIDLTSIDDVNLKQIYSKETIPDIAALEVKLSFTVSSNNTPEIESFGVIDNVKND